MQPFNRALSYYDLQEIPGRENNQEIMAMADNLGFEWYQDDETSWCALFMGFVAKSCGYKIPDKPQTARSWLNFGEEVKIPQVGDLAILWRGSPDSWMGHVGFFVRQIGNQIFLLGGNQDNRVKIKDYESSHLLGYRRFIDQS